MTSSPTEQRPHDHCAAGQEPQARVELDAAQQALARSEAAYRAIGELIPFGIWFADTEGRFTYVSDSFLRLVGMTLDECQGFGWTSRLRPEKWEQALADIRRCVEEGAPWDHEYEILGADGIYRTVLTRGVALRDARGRITGWGGRHLDISLRKRAEEALALSEERFRVALRRSQFMVFNQDRDLRYTWVYNSLPGFAAGGLLEKTDAEIMGEENARRLTEFKRAVIATGIGTHTDVAVAQPDGSIHFFDVALEPLFNVGGEISGLTGTTADVTDHRREQDRLRQLNETLEAAVAERTEHIAVIISQLRRLTQYALTSQEEERRRISRELHDDAGQALTALKMNLEMMRDELPSGLDPFERRLGDAVALTEQTIDEIRHLAQDLRPPALDSATLNAALEGQCREFARRSRLQVDYHGAEGREPDPMVKTCLYRFLQEALTNVYKHAQAHAVKVHFAADAEQVTVRVEDDGRGFDAGTAPQSAGIGLVGLRERLAIVGGALQVDSEPGRGTRLLARIPLKGVG